MKKQTFAKGMKRLHDAFNQPPMPEAQVRVYWDKLREWTDEEFSRAVEAIIEKERRFPTIAAFFDHGFHDELVSL